MAAYTDNRRKTWPIEFSDESLYRIRVLLKIDLADGNAATWDALQNHGTLLRVAQILCRDDIAACQMPTRQFMYRTVRFDPTGLFWAIRKAAEEWQAKDACPAETDSITDPEPNGDMSHDC